MTVLRALAAAWLTDRPHGAVDAAHQKLLDVRDAVHVVTGRGRDRLTREDHDAAAALLGYHDADALLTDVSTSARLIAYSLDGTLRRASQAQRARTLRVGPRRPRMTPLGYGLFLSDGEAVLGPGVEPAGNPLLSCAPPVAARNNVSHRADHPAEPRDELPAHPDALAPGRSRGVGGPAGHRSGAGSVWEGLDLAGVVETWIPEWAAVRSRPQRNAVHRHTVDRHLIETVVRAAACCAR